MANIFNSVLLKPKSKLKIIFINSNIENSLLCCYNKEMKYLLKNKENLEQNLTKEKQEKVYNLKNDIIFKAFFGRKGNEEFLISTKTERGTDYKDINQVIMINILDYELFGFEEYISETKVVLDKHREYEVMNGIKWYFIELPKFRRMNPNSNEKLSQWLFLLDDYDKEAIAMAEKKNPTI